MKLFQRIFATFCAVIICAIFVASFSFWLVQQSQAENHFNQQRAIDEILLANAVSAFRVRGEAGAREMLQGWHEGQGPEKILIITGDEQSDLLGRKVDAKRIEKAREYALENPDSKSVHLEYGRWGEEYLFFIRNWDSTEIQRRPSPLYIPGLPLEQTWHEIIIWGFIFLVGLALAYILANNITRPIRILGQGMKRLAAGELETRITQLMDNRDDELSQLAIQFDKMAQQLQQLVAKERLESELVRMDTLVGELLTLSRLETANVKLEKEPLKLVPFMRNLVEDSQTLAEKNGQIVDLVIEKMPEDAEILANESYLYRAFDNVIRNAMNYSPEGSTIKVHMRQDAKNWLMDVTDNGPGVAENQLPHIFTAFYRADSSGNKPGTGLGLALAKHIVEQHCGNIKAENMQPNGLRVCFIFPKKACNACIDRNQR